MSECQSCFDRQGVIQWREALWCPDCFEAEAKNRVDDDYWISRVLGVIDEGGHSVPLDATSIREGSA